MSVATEFAPSVSIPARARTHIVGVPPLAAPSPATPCPAAPLASVTVLAPPSARSLAPAVRLTHRGVVVVAVAVAVLGAALVWLAAVSAPAASAGGAAPGGPVAVTVQQGDTLWSIANRIAPAQDPRAEISTLQRLNHLVDAELTPGQTLRLR